MTKPLSKTAARILTDAANSPIGTVRPGGGAGWEARTAERETKKLVERGLLRPYHFNGEYEITDAGRAAYDSLTLV